MPIKIPNNVGSIYWGSTSIGEVYYGSQLVFSKSDPIIKGTYQHSCPSIISINDSYIDVTDLGSGKWTAEFEGSINSLAHFMEGNEVDTVNLLRYDTSGLSTLANAFSHASIKNASWLSSWIGGLTQHSDITDLEYCFEYAESDDPIDVSSWDTSHVTKLNQFSESAELEFVGMEYWDVHSVQSTESMFNRYIGSTLNLSNKNWSSCTNFNVMFYGAFNLYELDFSNWSHINPSASHDGMFNGCGVQRIKVAGCNADTINWLMNVLESCDTEYHGWHIEDQYIVCEY